MNRKFSNKTAICIFILPAFILYTVIVIFPIFLSGYYSTLKWDGIGKSVFVGFKNYVDLFINNNDGFTKAVMNSFILAGLNVFVQLPIALIFALILARGIKGESFYRTAYFIPVIISTVVIGELWIKIYNSDYGLLNTVLTGIGLKMLNHQWLSDTRVALMAVFIPVVWQYVGYHMLLMYAGAKSIPEDIFDAARIDGATGIKTAFRITIPLIKPVIRVCIVFAAVGSLKFFDLVYILTNGGPLHSTEVPSTLLYSTVFLKYMYGYGSSMAMFIIVECLLMTFIIQGFFKSGDSTY
ncbi:MAG: sugar ABC transporter permease [Clostridiales bacterium]|nr:sugar ABC transporter permease [Clostridiales bacterium]